MLELSLSIAAARTAAAAAPPAAPAVTLHFDARRIGYHTTLAVGDPLPAPLADLSAAFPTGSSDFRIEPGLLGVAHDASGLATSAPVAPFAGTIRVRATGPGGEDFAYESFADVLPGSGASVMTAGAAVALDPSPVSDPTFQRPGPYWPQIVDVSEIAPAGTPPLMLIASSDHADAESSAGGLYVWRASDPMGPWIFDGQFFTSTTTYKQMEAPTARVLEDPADGQKKLFIAAHYIPEGWASSGPDRHIQIPLLLVSDDAVGAPVPRDATAVDGRLAEFDAADTPFDEHRGYLTFAPNPFPALTDPATARPWPYLGNGLYGSGENTAEMQGRALWGFSGLSTPPALIERVADEDAHVWNGARTRPAMVFDLGSYAPHPEGGRWGFYLAAGHELRAVRTNDAGIAIRRGVSLWSAATDLPTLPGSLAGYAVDRLETVFTYRHSDGVTYAVIGARMADGAGAEANTALIVPLTGHAPPAMASEAKAIQGWDSPDIEVLHEGFAAVPSDISGNATAAGGALRLVAEASGDWAQLGWTSPEPLERYQYLAFQAEDFGDISGASPAHHADLWCMATPGASLPVSGAEGLYAGSDGTAPEGRVQAIKLLAPETLGTATRSSLSELRTGRDGGQANWRYGLGLGIWPRATSTEWGVLHEGHSLARWGGVADEFDCGQHWTFALSVRRADLATPYICTVGRLRLTGKLHDVTSALLPSAPSSLTATPEGGPMRLNWMRSRHSGGMPRIGHRIEERPAGGSWSVLVADTGSNAPTALVSALSGSALRVSEITAKGAGAPSAPVLVP